MKKIFLLALLPLAISPALNKSKLLPDEQNSVEIYQKSSPAVVNITAVRLRRDFFFEIVPQKGVGSGAIIRPDGYIITNDHVVGQASNVEVTLFDKTQYSAKVVGSDPDSDLAVIKIDPKGRKLTPLDYENSEPLSVGQKAIAIGNPFGLGGSMSVGIVSSIGRDIRGTTNRLIKNVIQTDAAINPGNSGGPLIDSSGKLVGINTQIVSQSGGSEGIGFAISAQTLKKIVPELIQSGRVLRPWIGIEGIGLSAELLAQFGFPAEQGVMVTDILPGSPVRKSGIRPADKEVALGFRVLPYGGDVIFQIDSAPVSTLGDILDFILDKKSGDSVTLHYLRGKTKKSATIKLSLPPAIRGTSM